MLTIPADAVIDELRGVVVGLDGRGLPGVRVRAHLVASAVMGSLTGIPGPETRSDAEGRFLLRNVPRRHVNLSASGDSIVESYGAIEDWMTDGELRIEVLRRCHVRIEGAAGVKVTFQDVRGEDLSIMLFATDSTFSTNVWTLKQGRSPVLTLPESATTMVSSRDGLEVGRQTIHLDLRDDAITLLFAAGTGR